MISCRNILKNSIKKNIKKKKKKNINNFNIININYLMVLVVTFDALSVFPFEPGDCICSVKSK